MPKPWDFYQGLLHTKIGTSSERGRQQSPQGKPVWTPKHQPWSYRIGGLPCWVSALLCLVLTCCSWIPPFWNGNVYSPPLYVWKYVICFLIFIGGLRWRDSWSWTKHVLLYDMTMSLWDMGMKCDLKENALYRFSRFNSRSQVVWHCGGRLRRCGLDGRSLSLGLDFEGSQPLTIPFALCFLLVV